MTELVAVDIGGTHARFALAEISGGRVASLGSDYTFKTAEHESLGAAWAAFSSQIGRPLPTAAAIAVAASVEGELLRFTNNPWLLRIPSLADELGLRRHILINDFGAVAHAVAQLDESHFEHLCGPDRPLPQEGVISIVGPGTGLGVAQLLRRRGSYDVTETEGGHIGFSPADALDEAVMAELRGRHGRVSVERVVSGPGLRSIYEAVAAREGQGPTLREDADLWKTALDGSNGLASAALERFCLSLGAVAGDIALAHGARAVVIAGGVGLRLRRHLHKRGFSEGFRGKGRFQQRMDEMPVKLITHAQPGLFGAAAAFAAAYSD